VDQAQAWESVGMMGSEIPKELTVLVETEEFANEFDGQDFAVKEQRVKAALADLIQMQGMELVIDQTEDVQDRIMKGHGVSRNFSIIRGFSHHEVGARGLGEA
jgi:hypothetical protein